MVKGETQKILQEGKLLSAARITQGDILSKWRWKHRDLDFEIELTQSQAYELLPVQVKYTSKSKEMPAMFGETEVKWKKHTRSGNYLPYVVKAAYGAFFGEAQKHHHWVFDWRLGKEIPDDFFDCESEDFRLQFSPLYDFYFDTYGKPGGVLTGTPWETPKELLESPE